MSVARVERPARSGPSPRSLQRALLGWFARHKRALPWRETRDPYRIWISEVMLQQTRVEAVKPYYARFMDAFPNVRELAKAPLDRVLKLWAGLGYYSRARNLHLAGQQVVSRYEGVVPASAAGLRTLPGIGRYTAAAIASIAFDERIAVLDGNVKRVLARLFAIRDSVDSPQTTAQLWELAESLVPARLPGDFNQAMMELGATVCTPRSPACPVCPLRAKCIAKKENLQHELPVKREKSAVPQIRIAAAAVRCADRILYVQRPPRGMLGGLWELPSAILQHGVDSRRTLREALRERFGISATIGGHIGTVTHEFTHRHWTIDVYACAWKRGEPATGQHSRAAWASEGEIESLALARVDAKVAEIALAAIFQRRRNRPKRPTSRTPAGSRRGRLGGRLHIV